jgi:hypothetical protein
MRRVSVLSLTGSGELEGGGADASRASPCGHESRAKAKGSRAEGQGSGVSHRPGLSRSGVDSPGCVGVVADREACVREAFPSSRQRRASGLKRSYYPDYLRDLVDYDYDESLPDDARVWLAAFTEEFYRGWRLKRETQLHGLTHLRAAGAENQRRRAHQDPMAFGKHRGEVVPERGSGDEEAAMITRLDRWRR